MIRKITSISILFLFVVTTAAPMIGAEDTCNMCCCEADMDACMLLEATTCNMAMSACDTPVLLPLVVAPVNKTEQKVNLEIDLVPVVRVELAPAESFIGLVQGQLILPHAPPTYNAPLII